jgi:hypothetical protein
VDDNIVVLFVQEGSTCPYITSTNQAASNVYSEFVRPNRDNHLSVGVYPDIGVVDFRHLAKLVEYLEQLTFDVYTHYRGTSFFWELRNEHE